MNNQLITWSIKLPNGDQIGASHRLLDDKDWNALDEFVKKAHKQLTQAVKELKATR